MDMMATKKPEQERDYEEPARRRSMLHLSAIRARIRLYKYRYEVTFGLYVMTSGEKLIFNSIVLVCLSLFLVALVVYFPRTICRGMFRLWWYKSGPEAMHQKFDELLHMAPVIDTLPFQIDKQQQHILNESQLIVGV